MSEKPVFVEELGESGGEDKDEEKAESWPAFMSPVIRRQFLQHMVRSLPPNTQKCIKACKNLQLEQLKHEVQFYEEVYQLQKKYQALYDPLHEKRKLIVSGEYTPTEAESEWKLDAEVDPETSEELKKLPAEVTAKLNLNVDPNAKGIPDFWLTVFRNTELLSELIHTQDEEVLKKLIDVRLVYKNEDPMSYLVEFHFAPNEYFTNAILTKQYFLRTTLTPDDPFAFEGPEIYKCLGCDINWNKGMNLTVKTVKKKQKHKARNAVRTVTKQIPIESFFHFFNPPTVPEDMSTLDIESQTVLTTDFEIGHIIRERIIPKAVLYFTGDMIDEDDDEDFEEEEEDDDDEEDEDDDDDDEKDPPKKVATSNKHSKNTKPGYPAECPQQ